MPLSAVQAKVAGRYCMEFLTWQQLKALPFFRLPCMLHSWQTLTVTVVLHCFSVLHCLQRHMVVLFEIILHCMHHRC